MAIHTIKVRKSDKEPRVKATVTKKFTVDGVSYESDLGTAEGEWFDRQMQELIQYARPVKSAATGGLKPGGPADIRRSLMNTLATDHGLTDLLKVRRAAAQNGLNVGDRGVISATNLRALITRLSG